MQAGYERRGKRELWSRSASRKAARVKCPRKRESRIVELAQGNNMPVQQCSNNSAAAPPLSRGSSVHSLWLSSRRALEVKYRVRVNALTMGATRAYEMDEGAPAFLKYDRRESEILRG